MTFPAPFTVDYYRYLGAVPTTIFLDETVDELGNEIESWADTPEVVAVQGWQVIAKEKLGVSATGLIADTALSAPASFVPGIRDRIGLPDGIYEVVELDMQANGFHGWKPGNVIMLKKATGI